MSVPQLETPQSFEPERDDSLDGLLNFYACMNRLQKFTLLDKAIAQGLPAPYNFNGILPSECVENSSTESIHEENLYPERLRLHLANSRAIESTSVPGLLQGMLFEHATKPKENTQVKSRARAIVESAQESVGNLPSSTLVTQSTRFEYSPPIFPHPNFEFPGFAKVRKIEIPNDDSNRVVLTLAGDPLSRVIASGVDPYRNLNLALHHDEESDSKQFWNSIVIKGVGAMYDLARASVSSQLRVGELEKVVIDFLGGVVSEKAFSNKSSEPSAQLTLILNPQDPLYQHMAQLEEQQRKDRNQRKGLAVLAKFFALATALAIPIPGSFPGSFTVADEMFGRILNVDKEPCLLEIQIVR
jgi:hypothetical protein